MHGKGKGAGFLPFLSLPANSRGRINSGGGREGRRRREGERNISQHYVNEVVGKRSRWLSLLSDKVSSLASRTPFFPSHPNISLDALPLPLCRTQLYIQNWTLKMIHLTNLIVLKYVVFSFFLHSRLGEKDAEIIAFSKQCTVPWSSLLTSPITF